MDIQNMKNMVVLKDLPSNMIEEAFVILKDNVKLYKQEFVNSKPDKEFFNKKDINENDKNNKNYKNNKDNKNNKSNKSNNCYDDNNYVIKEAEMIISEYLRSFEMPNEMIDSKEENKLKLKYKKLKIMNIFLIGFSILSVFSILIR